MRARRAAWGWAAAGVAALGAMGCPSGPVTPEVAGLPAKPALPPGVVAGRWPAGGRLLPAEGHLAKITCLSFSPDGRQLVSGSDDGKLLVWDVETGRVVQRLEGHRAFVAGCAFLRDGRRVVSGGWGGEVFVWDTATGEHRSLGELSSADAVLALSVRPDGRELMVGTDHGAVRAWNVEIGVETFRSDDLRVASKPSSVRTVGYLDDGRRFGGGEGGATILWDTKGPRRIDYVPTSGLALPGGRFALGGEDGLVVVDPEGTKHLLGQHEGYVYGLATNPRRDLLLTGDHSGNTSVWTFPSGLRRCQLAKSAGIWSAAFDATGERFAVAGDDSVIMLARTASCQHPASLVPLQRLGASRSRLSRTATGPSILVGDGI